MECPTCKAPYQPGDRFCGNCGERLPDAAPAAPPPAPPPLAAQGARPVFGGAPAAAPAAPAGAAVHGVPCPSCGSPLQPGQRKCAVCGMEFGVAGGPPAGAPAAGGRLGGGIDQPGSEPASPPQRQAPPATIAGGIAGVGAYEAPRAPAPPAPPPAPAAMVPGGAADPRPEARSGNPFCSIHGEMDATWTRCPQCIKEGREGRLSTPSGGVPRLTTEPVQRRPAAPDDALARPQPLSGGFPPAPAAPVPAGAPPLAQAPVGPPPQPDTAHPTAPAAPPAPVEAVRPPAGPPAPPAAAPRPPAVEPPSSSVGRTVVVRRRPRALAFLIEKEGEQVGRAFQLEEDVTDIGRDPRNHVAVSDVLVSAFHARVERAPDGGFYVRDRGSTNGTRVNGQVLTEPQPIDENDEVGIGNTTLVLKVVK